MKKQKTHKRPEFTVFDRLVAKHNELSKNLVNSSKQERRQFFASVNLLLIAIQSRALAPQAARTLISSN